MTIAGAATGAPIGVAGMRRDFAVAIAVSPTTTVAPPCEMRPRIGYIRLPGERTA